MSGPVDVRAAALEVAAAGCCRHPVRLGATTLDGATGELAERTVLVACKDRRAVLCPACAATYQADAWQLVASGLRGGKGVPETVAGHPACFVTLTAPSFGPVHRAGGTCHPRRARARCPHGVVLDCRERHAHDDPLVGRPLCPACFAYDEAVLWNARVTVLWQRTSTLLAREVARAGGGGAKSFRISYIKVVEFQRRGLVHLHVLLRADGPEGPSVPPPDWLTAELLAAGVERAVGRVVVPGIAGLAADAGWGTERTVRVLTITEAGGDAEAVAAYLAKYATKTATEDPSLTRSLDRRRPPVLAGADPHLAALATAAWELGRRPELAHLRLAAHAHTFGYRGHFATKSRAYSTTFGALRAARAAHVREEGEGRLEPLEGTWRYAGRGYGSPAAERLAEVLAEGIAGRPRRPPGTSPDSPPRVPRRPEQGR
ncbi:MAG: replication initiator [Acidimicrobiales bacterium]